MKSEETAYEGEWDFYGSCAPSRDGSEPVFAGQVTFTLGLFQWVRRGRAGSGKGLKCGKVQYRVKGRVDNAAAAYFEAERLCSERNSGATA